jgi:hypothetical protein
MKEQYEVEESGDMGRSMDVTPTPEYNSDKVLKIELSQLKSAYQQVTFCDCSDLFALF